MQVQRPPDSEEDDGGSEDDEDQDVGPSGPAHGSRPKSAAPSLRAPVRAPPPPLSSRPGVAGDRAQAPGKASPPPPSDIRARLVELYQVHNPPNVACVDFLLQKYQGQEEHLYRSACSKYQKADLGALPAQEGAGGGSATRAKAALPKPKSLPAPTGPSKAASKLPAPLAAANGSGMQRRTVRDAASSLLASIDLVLLGGRSGFFDDVQYESSGSDCSDSASESGSPSEGSSSEAGAGGSKPPTSHASGERCANGSAAAQSKASQDPPSLASRGVRGAPPALPPKRQAVPAGKPATSQPPPPRLPSKASSPAAHEQGPGQGQGVDDLEDDDALMNALHASMKTAADHKAGRQPPQAAQQRAEAPRLEVPRPPPRSEAQRQDNASRPKGAPASAGTAPRAADASHAQATKAKLAGWGAPPPLRGKAQAVAKAKAAVEAGSQDRVAVGVKAKAPPTSTEPPAPQLFEQWLASLKFLSGWNDHKTPTQDEVTRAFKEHLNEEGIETGRTVDQLCDTMVPLLLDLRKTDAAVMKNIRVEVLRQCKMVQLSILRLVTFELCRERELKDSQRRSAKKRRAQREADAKPDPAQSAPHLASNIDALAKVIRHFRLGKQFNEALQKLILSIRRQKRKVKAGQKEPKRLGRLDDKVTPPKRRRPRDASRSRDGPPTGRGEGAPPLQRARRDP